MAAASNVETAAAQLENIKPPPGIIVPPPGEIREAIEKTAGYVIRGGLGLEQRIRENHGANPKFSFLMTDSDAYNAYYEWRKQEIKAGRGTAVAAGRVGEEAATASAKPETKGPPKPSNFQFSARMPRMSQKDLEIVRLTALFVAKNGRQFMTQLAQREAGNPQFQFLIPNHTFHNFFQSMLDQYSVLLRDSGVNGEGNKAQQQRVAELKKNVEDKFHVLIRAKQRAEYNKWLEEEKAKKEEEEEKKKIEYARIDWNDFVVAETIVFTESDEQANLPPPTTLNDLQYASLEEKNKVSISSNLRIEEAFPFDETSYSAYPAPVYGMQTPAPAVPAPSETQQYAAPTPSVPRLTNGAHVEANGRNQFAPDAEEERKIQEREQARLQRQQAQTSTQGGKGPIKIRENYVSRTAARAAKNFGLAMGTCPNCKQQIPHDEMDEHIRIELLDPRWKEQKAKADARTATTNLATQDASSNLKRLASQRADLFDSAKGEELSEEEIARRKKASLNSFDGNPEGKSQAHMNQLLSLNVEEQIRNIHQKFGEKK